MRTNTPETPDHTLVENTVENVGCSMYATFSCENDRSGRKNVWKETEKERVRRG